MASIFIDWDGTSAYAGTTTFLPGVVDQMHAYLESGHQIFLTTARTDVGGVVEALEEAGLSNVVVIPGVQNPRVVINDMGAYAINHPADSPWRNYQRVEDLPVQEI